MSETKEPTKWELREIETQRQEDERHAACMADYADAKRYRAEQDRLQTEFVACHAKARADEAEHRDLHWSFTARETEALEKIATALESLARRSA